MAILLGKKVKLFSLSANVELAEEIAESVGIPLSSCDILHFADGEINVQINETVRGHNVFVIQPTSAPVNDHLMELLIMCDALKRASAKTINLVIPYYGYSRQDRKSRSRQPISAKLVADLLQVAGADRVICMDIHAAQIQGFFDIPVDNFMGLPVLANYFIDKKLTDVVVVSPDHGGTTRAREFAKVLDTTIAIIDKRRPEPNKAEVMNIIGNVAGKTCILVDDMCDTAGTLTIGAKALMDAGAKEVYAACTHGVLSGEAISRIANSCLKEMVITNTIRLDESKRIDKINVLSVGTLLGHGILRILSDEPLSGLFIYSYDKSKRELL
ncbi:MAG TPA: ribose-phosphate pyrophosphokinase [Candidatus Pelethenecus faecipullorum]|uniref:Ribose-phosphate pyrophosphokinase n=1 Tax=Candidatus Pelethenecus faecipullorum TaxID=2840900 RepID=A0A9D1KI74_9MOLU|nr:ribose-phosphate pyrophosphokinase [Candidatus Pelethenecus faecipullorum]